MKCGAMVHILTVVAIIAFIASLVRCVILSTIVRQKSNNTSPAFDIIHSFIQGAHVLEYLVLLYGIGGFYLYAVIDKDNFNKLNDAYKKSFECKWYTRLGVIFLCVLGLIIYIPVTITPIVILTHWPYIVTTDTGGSENITKDTRIGAMPIDTRAYIGIAYISHACHSFTRIFMICVTVVVRTAWHQTEPLLRTNNVDNSLMDCAKVILSSTWLEDKLESDMDAEDDVMGDPQERFVTLIKNYNQTGHFIAPLNGIFQQWFVMQWIVYFIKLLEDFTVIMNYLLNDKKIDPEIIFVTIHLVYDLILFLVPYYCVSLMNQYHDDYHRRLQKMQNKILGKDNGGWRLQCALLIPENPNYTFIPSFCGLSIPLSSPGYNLSIILALLAILITI